MDSTNIGDEYATIILDTLDADSMSLIDFDQLKQWIEMQRERNEVIEGLQAELLLLRDDYQKRITGMLKAIAVADRKNDRYAMALQLIEDLPAMTGVELTDCYSRTSAKFRDMFPTSLGQFLTRSDRAGRPKDLSVYK